MRSLGNGGRRARLAAAHRYKQQIDADWSPGEPYVRQLWTTDGAWHALLTHLGSVGATVHVDDGEIRVVQGTEQTIYRMNPAEWAAHLRKPKSLRRPTTPTSCR